LIAWNICWVWQRTVLWWLHCASWQTWWTLSMYVTDGWILCSLGSDHCLQLINLQIEGWFNCECVLMSGLLSIFSKSIADIRYRYWLKKYRWYRYRYFAVKVSISRSILRYRYFYSDHTVATSVDGREPRDYGVRKHCNLRRTNYTTSFYCAVINSLLLFLVSRPLWRARFARMDSLESSLNIGRGSAKVGWISDWLWSSLTSCNKRQQEWMLH